MHPMEAKKRLAAMIVAGVSRRATAARDAREYFETNFQRREVPQDVPVFSIADELWVCELMKQSRFARRPARRAA